MKDQGLTLDDTFGTRVVLKTNDEGNEIESSGGFLGDLSEHDLEPMGDDSNSSSIFQTLMSVFTGPKVTKRTIDNERRFKRQAKMTDVKEYSAFGHLPENPIFAMTKAGKKVESAIGKGDVSIPMRHTKRGDLVHYCTKSFVVLKTSMDETAKKAQELNVDVSPKIQKRDFTKMKALITTAAANETVRKELFPPIPIWAADIDSDNAYTAPYSITCHGIDPNTGMFTVSIFLADKKKAIEIACTPFVPEDIGKITLKIQGRNTSFDTKISNVKKTMYFVNPCKILLCDSQREVALLTFRSFVGKVCEKLPQIAALVFRPSGPKESVKYASVADMTEEPAAGASGGQAKKARMTRPDEEESGDEDEEDDSSASDECGYNY
jgi:hypothetical protein